MSIFRGVSEFRTLPFKFGNIIMNNTGKRLIMMKKKVLIIEDDSEQIKMLKQLIMEINGNTEVYMAENVACAYQLMLEKTIDVFLVDIILDKEKPGDASGIRLVEKLRQIPKYYFTPVIFVTSMEDQEMHAYRNLNCFGYIEKPYDPVQVKEKVERALHYTTEREKDVTLPLKKDNILYPVKLKDIVYMESVRHTMHIHLTNGEVLPIPYITCKRILEEADTADSLLPCARGVLVNREYVYGIDLTNKYLMLKDNYGMITMGGKYKKKLLEEFEG